MDKLLKFEAIWVEIEEFLEGLLWGDGGVLIAFSALFLLFAPSFLLALPFFGHLILGQDLKNLRVNLQKEKDILGTNLAGLKLIKREIKDRDLKGIESLEKLQK